LTYADIILPLPLEGYFTYAVPAELQDKVQFGMRVLVPFGAKKHYIGIVASLHDKKPEGFEVKPLEQVLDDYPILLESQFRLWKWIADYYMSPIG
jgi:primosomal protein N' (replication factor Y)